MVADDKADDTQHVCYDHVLALRLLFLTIILATCIRISIGSNASSANKQPYHHQIHRPRSKMAIPTPMPDSFPTCGDPSLDCRLVCDGLAFPTSQKLLSNHSLTFKNLLDRMPAPKRLNITATVFHLVEPMMEIFYTYEYTAPADKALKFHMEMLLVAEILGCTFLERKAVEMLEAETLKPSPEVSMEELIWLIKHVEERYAEDPVKYGELRTIATNAARYHFASLFYGDNLGGLMAIMPNWTVFFLRDLVQELESGEIPSAA